MSLETELAELMNFGLEAFNNQTGSSFQPDDMKMMLNRPSVGSLVDVLFITKAPGDHVRFQLNVSEFGSANDIDLFTLKLRNGHTSGSLSDEVHIARAKLSKFFYGTIEKHIKSHEFVAYVSKEPSLKTTSGKTIYLNSGFKLKTQR